MSTFFSNILLALLDVCTPTLSFTDFRNFTEFKRQALHLENMNVMLEEVSAWGDTLKVLRLENAEKESVTV